MGEIYVKRIILAFLLFCILLTGCVGENNNKDSKMEAPVETTNEDENAKLRKDIADFCSKIELFNASLSILIADQETENRDESEEMLGYLEEARKLCDEKIQKSNADTVYINDIKYDSYGIVVACDVLLELLGDSELSDTMERQEEIESSCEKLKSYLD